MMVGLVEDPQPAHWSALSWSRRLTAVGLLAVLATLVYLIGSH